MSLLYVIVIHFVNGTISYTKANQYFRTDPDPEFPLRSSLGGIITHQDENAISILPIYYLRQKDAESLSLSESVLFSGGLGFFGVSITMD